MGVKPDAKKWDSWNQDQKDRFRRDAKYSRVIKHPDEFHVAKVGKPMQKELKGSGYYVTPTGKAIIPLETSERGRFDSVKIKKGKLIFKGGGITEIVTPSTAKNFHSKIAELTKKKLKKNQMLTVKIGDNASFNHRFGSYADLYKYLTTTGADGFNRKHGITDQQLGRYMSIVEVETKAETRKQRMERQSHDSDYIDFSEPIQFSGSKSKSKAKNTKANLTRK